MGKRRKLLEIRRRSKKFQLEKRTSKKDTRERDFDSSLASRAALFVAFAAKEEDTHTPFDHREEEDRAEGELGVAGRS